MRFTLLLLKTASLYAALSTAAPADSATAEPKFNPFSYTKKFVKCPAVDRTGPKPRDIELKLAYLDVGNPNSNKILILVHGWPSMWTTYREQILHFQKDYRLILPEHRGYGDSEHPQDLFSSNTFPDFVNDIQCMMDDAKVRSGVCVGNDFGAQVCWEAGRSRPDRFIGVFNVGLPVSALSPNRRDWANCVSQYMPATGNFTPNEALAKANPSFSYQVYLGTNPRGAAAEMDADIRSSIRSCAHIANSTLPKDFLQHNDTFLGPWKAFQTSNGLKEIPISGIMDPVVEDYMVQAYSKQGFYNSKYSPSSFF
jgi:soluble epoxide hydrolase/lipid-phosphate phosphatase